MALFKYATYFFIILNFYTQFQAIKATTFTKELPTHSSETQNVTCNLGHKKVHVNIQTDLKNDIRKLFQEFNVANKAETTMSEIAELKQTIAELQVMQKQQAAILEKLQIVLLDQFKGLNTEIIAAMNQTFEAQVEKVTKATIITEINYKNNDEHFNCVQNCGFIENLPSSCEEIPLKATTSGAYLLNMPGSSLKPFYALCQRFEGNTWTVIQSRVKGNVDFNHTWQDYVAGFGNLDIDGDFWLGLDRLHAMTSKHTYELYIRLRNQNGVEKYARFARFMVGSAAEKYKLTIDGYRGDAGDALAIHNGMKFSTFDNDNDADANRNCAKTYEGGWWFSKCHNSNLNGPFTVKNSPKPNGIAWNFSETFIKFSQMSIRRSPGTDQYVCNCAKNGQDLKQLVCSN